jgi:micrococcal nuclease
VRLALLVLASALAAAYAAHADPCKAIPDNGPLPVSLRPGAAFSGPVAYVGDGDSLCVAVGPEPAEWVEVRLADFYAPELREAGGEAARAALVGIAKGRRVECVADHRSFDRVVAVCRLQGVSLGDLLRRAGIREGGRGR